ncbi:hypothetical protein [Polynucleobacter necessarius]|nr:hypothetical protein [Polynucleobacter necessarius]
MNTPALKSAAYQLNIDDEEFSQWLLQALVKSGAALCDGMNLMDQV